MNNHIDKTQIRNQINERRRSLDAEFQLQAAQKICHQLINMHPIKNAKTIALYCAAHSEADPFAIIEYPFPDKKIWALPVLLEGGRLDFFPFQHDEELTINKFGIPEPNQLGTPIDLTKIDVILLPLVAFDKNGNRLGRGKGYYDKTLAAIDREQTTLIGIAYDFQLLETLPIEDWDVPLDKVVTEKKIY